DTDKDGSLTPVEWSGWRSDPADLQWIVRLGLRPSDKLPLEQVHGDDANVYGSLLTFAVDKVRFSLRADEGKLADWTTAARKRLEDRFAQADANLDGFLVPTEVVEQPYRELKLVLAVADLDGNGQLDRKELEAWCALDEQITHGLVLFSVLDH